MVTATRKKTEILSTKKGQFGFAGEILRAEMVPAVQQPPRPGVQVGRSSAPDGLPAASPPRPGTAFLILSGAGQAQPRQESRFRFSLRRSTQAASSPATPPRGRETAFPVFSDGKKGQFGFSGEDGGGGGGSGPAPIPRGQETAFGFTHNLRTTCVKTAKREQTPKNGKSKKPHEIATFRTWQNANNRRLSSYEPKGRGFESLLARHRISQKPQGFWDFLFSCWIDQPIRLRPGARLLGEGPRCLEAPPELPACLNSWRASGKLPLPSRDYHFCGSRDFYCPRFWFLFVGATHNSPEAARFLGFFVFSEGTATLSKLLSFRLLLSNSRSLFPRDSGPPPSNSGTKTALLTGIVLAVHPAGTPGFPGFFPFFEGTPALLESPFQEGWEPFFQTGSLPFCPWGRREGPFSTAHNCAIIVALFEKILAKKRGAVYHASDCVCKGGKHWLGPPVF